MQKSIELTKEELETICVICNEPFKGYGNNAQPLKEGLCCDPCNTSVIITRLSELNIQDDIIETIKPMLKSISNQPKKS